MDLTDRQKAVLIWAAAEKIENWQTIYILSSDKPVKSFEGRYLVSQVSNWKRQDKVQSFFRLQVAKFRELEEAAENWRKLKAGEISGPAETLQNKGDFDGVKDENGEIIGEGSEGPKNGLKTAKKGKIDYLDRSQLLSELNRLANNLTDIKQRTDIIKIIADLAKMKESDAKSVDIRRFYLPLSCGSCELYQAARGRKEAKPAEAGEESGI